MTRKVIHNGRNNSRAYIETLYGLEATPDYICNAMRRLDGTGPIEGTIADELICDEHIKKKCAELDHYIMTKKMDESSKVLRVGKLYDVTLRMKHSAGDY